MPRMIVSIDSVVIKEVELTKERTAAGAITVMESGETSMILGIPQWISQALMVPGFALLGVVGIYMMVHCWGLRNVPVTEVKP